MVYIIHLEICKTTHVIEPVCTEFHLKLLRLLGRQKIPDGLVVNLQDID